MTRNSNSGGWTKGPLRAERRKTCSVVLQDRATQDGYSNRVADLHQWKPAPPHQPDGDEAYATALLFAAAPDLAEAVAVLLAAFSGQAQGDAMLEAVAIGDAALSKALGQ